MLSAKVINPTAKHTASVIFLHGLGDSGHGWAPVGEMLQEKLPNVKWIFPHAPQRSITVNMGMRMPGWYDIVSLERIEDREDKEGLMDSRKKIQDLIEKEMDLGIPNSRIILGGFSQGAAMSLLTGLTSSIKLGGLIALSGYLPIQSEVDRLATDANKTTPIFMGHGDADEVVHFKFGTMTRDHLLHQGYRVQFETYRNMGHSACDREFMDMHSFISKILS